MEISFIAININLIFKLSILILLSNLILSWHIIISCVVMKEQVNICCVHVVVLCNIRSYNCHITGGGTDYGSGPYTVIFPAGSTAASLSISINNDNIVETNETFSLTINSSNDIMAIDPDNAVVTIVDDDSE